MKRHAYNTGQIRPLVSGACALVLGLSLTVWWGSLPAHAACINCETIDTPPTSTLTLNGADQLATYTLSLTVNNLLTGGWNVTITSSPFATSGSPTHTLAANASTITAVAEQCATGNVCVSTPTNQVTYPLALPAGSPTPTPAKLYNASSLTGIGTFTLTTSVTVAVPANTYAGAYTSTLTLAFATGP